MSGAAAEVDPQAARVIQELEDDPEQFTAFAGEVMLLDWRDSPRGQVVTLLLPENEGINPFKRFHCVEDNAIGARFMASIVELTDDDLPVNQEQRARVHERIKGEKKKPSQVAAIIARERDFHLWLQHLLTREGKGIQQSKAYACLPASSQKIVDSTRLDLFDPALKTSCIQVCEGFIYGVCKIESRKELDRHPGKQARFERVVLYQFHLWQEANG